MVLDQMSVYLLCCCKVSMLLMDIYVRTRRPIFVFSESIELVIIVLSMQIVRKGLGSDCGLYMIYGHTYRSPRNDYD